MTRITRSTALIFITLGFAACARGEEAAAPGKITFTIPQDTHVTVAIDSAAGVRVRNLFADVPFTKGEHTVEWDGRDDAGQKLTAGDYHWRGLFHGDLHAVYQGAFQYGTPPWPYGKTGGWTSDHSYNSAIVAVGDRVVTGATYAEWGHGLIASDLDGHKVWGTRWLNKRAWAGADALASVGPRVFSTAVPDANLIWEIDSSTGDNWIVVESKDLPADQVSTEGREPGLKGTGMRVIGGRQTVGDDGELYVADLTGKEPRTYVFSTAVAKPGDKLKLLRVLPVRPWSLTWLADGRCIAAMDKTLDVLDTTSGKTTPFVSSGLEAPVCVTSDARGRVYVSDQGGTAEMRYNPNAELPYRGLRLTDHASMQIKIFDNQGKLLRTMGKEGGQQVGAIDPNDFWRPAGIAIDGRGKLWVTEMTYLPKRISVWDIPDDLSGKTPSVAMQFFGPAAYGGGAAMIDPAKPWRIMDTNYGVTFDVNLDTGAYNAVDFPWRPYWVRNENCYRPDLPLDGKPTTIFKLDGREFCFLQGGYQHGAEAHWMPYTQMEADCGIGELRNGKFVPMAAIGNIRMMLRARELNARWEDQWLAAPLLEACKRLPNWKELCTKAGMDPEMSDAPHVVHQRGIGAFMVSPWPKEMSGFIWTDTNGDGKMQPEELQIFSIQDCSCYTFDSQLNLYLSLNPERGEEPGIFRLNRSGFDGHGAPVYHWSDAKRLPDGFAFQVGAEWDPLESTCRHASLSIL